MIAADARPLVLGKDVPLGLLQAIAELAEDELHAAIRRLRAAEFLMMGGFLFFRYLQAERLDLLDFRAAGSKWPIVHGWLRDRLQD
jgi:hypothetical protein